jgi:acetylglutamate kinase
MDSMTNSQKAEVLISALPYIQKYYNKTVVVKYGGNAMINEDLKRAVMGDVVLLSLIGVRVVLVHGGGPEITEMLTKINKKTEFIDGLRVTDKETRDCPDGACRENQQEPCWADSELRRQGGWSFGH